MRFFNFFQEASHRKVTCSNSFLKKNFSEKLFSKKAAVSFFTALALIVCLTACGGSDKSSSNSNSGNGGKETQSTAQAEAPEDGVLRTAILYDISTMDVSKTTDDYMIPMNIFERLFETRMIDGTAQIVNSLCEDYSVSDDGLKYDFVLKDGVVFSNGSPLTASDVKYSFERLLIAAGQNTDIPLEIVGGEDLMNQKADTLAGFTVTDDTHFSIALTAPNAGFIAELSSPVMSIVDAETMEKVKNFGTEPGDTIGSGPYVITEWKANDHYTLVYNDKYHGDEPSVKKVIVSVIPDPSTQNLMFMNGELDMIDLMSQDSMIVESSYKKNSEYADRIVSTPYVGISYLLLNEDNKYLKDVNVRKAIGMAIDADSIITNLFNGDAIRENGVIPTGIWGHNDQFSAFSYDPDGAKKLIEKSGYKKGEISFELSMDSSSNSATQLVCQDIVQSLEEIGIKVVLKSYDHASWLNLRNSGKMDSFLARWGMDYNDPSNIMIPFFGSVENTKSRSLNYYDKDVIARVAAASSIVDDDERMAEYRALEEKIIGEDAAWIPLYTTLHLYCMGSRVESFTPYWSGFSDFNAIDVVLK